MKNHNATRGERSMPAANSNSDLGALFDGHIAGEFADFDVDATMETMVAEPYVHCVPTLTGGFGGREVRRFYTEHFINQIPKDAKVTPVSRTIGKDQVVDELIVSFTHDTQWDYALPVPACGSRRLRSHAEPAHRVRSGNPPLPRSKTRNHGNDGCSSRMAPLYSRIHAGSRNGRRVDERTGARSAAGSVGSRSCPVMTTAFSSQEIIWAVLSE